ncbi:hypothetical protein B296_00034181 [Ensete ventricosum]|uniref:Uncharacterized protein n=1 Tax=Ensete ventricosum TaxID=4639 RepID=A0A427A2P6_ENSVE|nr:hypothetical protein B296_00034181 [Ensete ventricosum]
MKRLRVMEIGGWEQKAAADDQGCALVGSGREEGERAETTALDSQARRGRWVRQVVGGLRAAADVAVGGEEWLAAAIEEESKATVKKAYWKRQRACTKKGGKEEQRGNSALLLSLSSFSFLFFFCWLLQQDDCCNDDDGEIAGQHGDEKRW